MAGKRILILATSHDVFPTTGQPTGCWLEELAAPYYAFKKAGAEVDVVSVKGGKIPMDPHCMTPEALTEDCHKYLNDAAAVKLMENSPSIKHVNGDYDAIFLPGGHGVVFDVTDDKDCIALLERHWADGKVLSAVCHGPGGLLNVKSPNGDWIMKGKKVAGFTNSEEEAVKLVEAVPYLLETEIIQRGGLHQWAPNWAVHAVADGNLVTGQNPGSSEKTAELVLAALG